MCVPPLAHTLACVYTWTSKKIVVLASCTSYAELRSSTIRLDVKNYYSFQSRLFPMRMKILRTVYYDLTLTTSLLYKISRVFWELQFRKLLLSMCLSESFTKCRLRRIKWEDGHFLRVTPNFIFIREFCYRDLFFETDYRVSLSLSLGASCRDLSSYYLTIYTWDRFKF